MKEITIDKNLKLVPLREESAELIFDIINKNRNFLRVWLPFVDTTTELSHTRDFIKNTLTSDCLKKDMVFEVICSERLCGLVALKETDPVNKKSELGYWLAEKEQGKGVMLNSCRGILHFAFNELKMNRITIKCAVGNEKSQQIPFRLQFEFEGIERQGEYLNGKFIDLKVYSLLKKEWLIFNKTT